jgi:hypothetical protein
MGTHTAPAFDPLDPLSLDSLLSDDEIALRDTVAGFCRRTRQPAHRRMVRDRRPAGT